MTAVKDLYGHVQEQVTAVVGKAFRLMLNVTEPLDDVMPADSVADVAAVNLVAIAAWSPPSHDDAA